VYLSTKPRVVVELNPDVSTDRDGLGQQELCHGVCPSDVVIGLGGVDLCLVQPYNEGGYCRERGRTGGREGREGKRRREKERGRGRWRRKRRERSQGRGRWKEGT